MADELRRPLPNLSPEERKRRLAERGLDENMVPFNATPEERQAAMTNLNQSQPAVVIANEPAQGAVLKQPVVQVLTIVAIVAAAALAASESGVLPHWVGAVAQGTIGLLAAFGIASPGIRKAQ